VLRRTVAQGKPPIGLLVWVSLWNKYVFVTK
jgi:hypothetical protein